MYPDCDVKRGDIFLVDLGVNIGSVQGGKRPVLIVSNDMNNIHCPVVNVMPLSSRIDKARHWHVIIDKEYGLDKTSYVIAEQVLTIDKSQLINKKCHIPNEILIKINDATQKQLCTIDIGYINSQLKIINHTRDMHNKYQDESLLEAADVYTSELRRYCNTYGVNFNNVIDKRMIQTIYFTRGGAIVNG